MALETPNWSIQEDLKKWKSIWERQISQSNRSTNRLATGAIGEATGAVRYSAGWQLKVYSEIWFY